MKTPSFIGFGPFLAVLVSLFFSNAWAVEDVEDVKISPDAAPSVESNPEISQSLREEKAKLLQILKGEVEPNLVKGDIEKLQRNVMRLGSYRKDWVLKSQSTLLANPALSELYIYRYATVKNERLNQALLDTLLQFNNFRFPRATLAFADDLAKTPADKIKYLSLVAKAAQQDPSLTAEAFQLLMSDWGKEIPVESKLYFAEKVCGRLPRVSNFAQVRAALDEWMASSGEIWNKIVSAEVHACLRGG